MSSYSPLKFRPLLHPAAISLRQHWRTSPAKWSKLKKVLIADNGPDANDAVRGPEAGTMTHTKYGSM
jgi:hypothetical protein